MLTPFLPATFRLSRWLFMGVLGATPVVLSAQVGHRPSQSPFEDVKLGQTISLSSGWLAYGRDPAGVAPESAPFGQLRYDVGVGGPASLFARYTLSPTQRTLFAPLANAVNRKTGTAGVYVHVLDAGLDVALTGNKSWHHIIPSISGGAGIVSDYASVDSGGYQFGVKFEIAYGFALRYVLPSGLRLRVEANSFRWQYDYPSSYYVKAPDGTAVVLKTGGGSSWEGNWAWTAGFSYPIFR